MKRFIAMALMACCATVGAAPSDSYCVKIGRLMQSNAEVMEAGGTENDLAASRPSLDRSKGKSKNQQRIDAENNKIIANVTSYVFTVKQDSKTARLIGYKKCLAGDFD